MGPNAPLETHLTTTVTALIFGHQHEFLFDIRFVGERSVIEIML